MTGQLPDFTMNDEIRERHKQDDAHAGAVRYLVDCPLDLPSLERQAWHSFELGDEPFLSAGYTWRDKPHRILHDAITEIRALRSFIAQRSRVAMPEKTIQSTLQLPCSSGATDCKPEPLPGSRWANCTIRLSPPLPCFGCSGHYWASLVDSSGSAVKWYFPKRHD